VVVCRYSSGLNPYREIKCSPLNIYSDLLDIILVGMLYSSRLKVCRTLDPHSLLKDVKWKTCLRKAKDPRQPHSLLLTAIRFTFEKFNTGVCRALRDALSVLISSTCERWTLMNPEERTTICCWMSSWTYSEFSALKLTQVFKFN